MVPQQQIPAYRYVKKVKSIDPEIGDKDLEIMLVNSLKIDARKVQEVPDVFLIDKKYISIFCFTEIKVDCIYFILIGVKLYTKH